MGCADGVATHGFHHLNLADEGSLVFGSAEGSEVVVETHSLNLTAHAIELETVFAAHRDGAYTGLDGLHIDQAAPLIAGEAEPIERGRLGRPESGLGHTERGLELGGVALQRVGSHHPTLGIGQRDHSVATLAHIALKQSVHLDLGLIAGGTEGAHIGVPGREGGIAIELDMDRTVETATRIPARALFAVVEMHLDKIVLGAKLDKGCDVDAEGVVAIGPAACLTPVDAHHGFAHGSVEHQYGALVALGQRQTHTVISLTYPGQRARAARLLGLLGLAVLLDGDHLQIPLLVERPRYSPIVGHPDGLPRLAVA